MSGNRRRWPPQIGVWSFAGPQEGLAVADAAQVPLPGTRPWPPLRRPAVHVVTQGARPRRRRARVVRPPLRGRRAPVLARRAPADLPARRGVAPPIARLGGIGPSADEQVGLERPALGGRRSRRVLRDLPPEPVRQEVVPDGPLVESSHAGARRSRTPAAPATNVLCARPRSFKGLNGVKTASFGPRQWRLGRDRTAGRLRDAPRVSPEGPTVAGESGP